MAPEGGRQTTWRLSTPQETARSAADVADVVAVVVAAVAVAVVVAVAAAAAAVAVGERSGATHVVAVG